MIVNYIHLLYTALIDIDLQNKNKNMTKHRNINTVFWLEDYAFLHILYLSDIGDGWKPVVLNTQEEYDFIRESQKVLSNSVPYWIGGSANYLPNVTINYIDYIANSSGTHTV